MLSKTFDVEGYFIVVDIDESGKFYHAYCPDESKLDPFLKNLFVITDQEHIVHYNLKEAVIDFNHRPEK
ncbi:MAG: hypothetical protein HOP31_08945 [Ignavibacteria bacterium]|nr:hypothetical protein [Ignavibacteria bacterium]